MDGDRGMFGPYTAYDGLPPLRKGEVELPLAHPYGPVAAGRFITPGGGRLTVTEDGGHHQVRVDHLGCDAQTTAEKNQAYRRLALAVEAHCLLAGHRHPARFADGPLRCFEFPHGTVEPRVFVRALLAIEVGDHKPLERLAAAAEDAAGPVRAAGRS